MGATMKRLLSLVFLGLAMSSAAFAQLPIPVLRGPQDPSQATAVLNNLINQINGILVPSIGGPTGAVNMLSMTGGLTGQPGVIGFQSGADTNASIQINPNGSGDIILFSQYDTGVLKFANQTMFVPAKSLIACPGVPEGKAAPIGVSNTVTGFTPIKDWLGRSHAWPTC